MAGLVDIHAHVIPGIDDGPPMLADSVALVRAAYDAGTRVLAATPHLHSRFPDVYPAELKVRLQDVRDAVGDLDIELVNGGEVQLTWALDTPRETLELVSYGQRGTDILIETPSSGIFGIDIAIGDIHAKGFRVVLAHPERGMASDSDYERLERLSYSGVILQVNAESLLAKDRTLRTYARELCTRGLASVIASDGHRAAERRPITVLKDGVAELTRLVGEERAQWMSSAVPGAVVRGERLPPEPAVEARRGLFRRR